MVSYLTDQANSKQEPEAITLKSTIMQSPTWRKARGYIFALLLGLTSLLKVRLPWPIWRTRCRQGNVACNLPPEESYNCKFTLKNASVATDSLVHGED